jgi:hypothetical protein
MPGSHLSRVPKYFVAVAVWIAWMAPQPAAAQDSPESVPELSRQVSELTAMIMELRSEIAASRAETRQLRAELERALEGTVTRVAFVEEAESPQAEGEGPSVEQRVAVLEENQRVLRGQVEEQYQTKVESASRYRTRLSGIVLLNGFLNRGLVDSQEAPNLAAQYGPFDAREAVGFSVLQSQLGFEAFGPTLLGSRVSGGLQFDFFGVSPDSDYASSWGGVRLRTAIARMDWARTSLVFGQDAPFLSPRSPSSVASLAYPAFSHSGNLWTWVPQARVEHRFATSESSSWTLQGGIFGPVRRGSPQPAYGTRLAWSRGEDPRELSLGAGAYYSREDRGFGRTHDDWAATIDWMVPFGERLALSGEFYRGRGLGGLGAGQGRSLVFDGP